MPGKLQSCKIRLTRSLPNDVIESIQSFLSNSVYLQELSFMGYLGWPRRGGFFRRLLHTIVQSASLLSVSLDSNFWHDRQALILDLVLARNRQLPQILVAPRTEEDANPKLSVFPTVSISLCHHPNTPHGCKFSLTGVLTLDYTEHALCTCREPNVAVD
jgi:hypothetical protein